MKKVKDNLISIFLIALILFLPFQALTGAFLDKYLSSGAAFWIAHWYEPVIIILFAISIIQIILKQRKLGTADWIAFALIALGIASILFLSPTISRGMEGFRFTLFALLAFVSIRHYHISNILITYYLIIAGLVAIWAVVERALPFEYWTNILGDTFGWGNFSIVKYYQSSSVLAGPNQLASYLIPALFIVIDKISKSVIPVKTGIQKLMGSLDSLPNGRSLGMAALAAPIIACAIAVTFSRSAWVAVAATLIISFVIMIIRGKEHKNIVKYVLGGLSAIIIVGSAYLLFATQISKSDVITHGQSQSQHIYAIKDSIAEIIDRKSQPVKLIFGSGLGTAGPAVIKYGDGFVSESWYLQLALELGILGLGLWIALIVTLIVRMWREHQEGLMLGLIGVSIAAIFLHTWADNPALATTLFLLIGVGGTEVQARQGDNNF